MGHLPILTSECPGWVCYTEKQIGEDFFPFMSKVKSPQQLLGKLVKLQAITSLSQRGIPITEDSLSKIKMVTIMPCYDKKLEATRPKLRIPSSQPGYELVLSEVDTVLATHEIIELLQKTNTDLASIPTSN